MPANQLSRQATEYAALVEGLTSTMLQVEEVHLSMGTQFLDYAVVAVDLGHIGAKARLHAMDLASLELETPDGGTIHPAGREMTIVALVDGRRVPIHWGRISGREIDLDQNETLHLVSRVEPVHFGQPIIFQQVWSPIAQAPANVHHEIVFNPQFKGAIIGNMRRATIDGKPDEPIFIDPGSIETFFAAEYQEALVTSLGELGWVTESGVNNWTLADAVRVLCRIGNPIERFIQNPQPEELASVLPSDPQILKNHGLRMGLYLNQALEELLAPYGFTFKIEYSLNSRKLAIVQRGVGEKKTVRWQPIGSKLELSEQFADEAHLQFDASMAVNAVAAWGDYTYLEATFELMPGWPANLDNSDVMDLTNDGEDWQQHPERHDVWRKWVLNEAGDYNRGWTNVAAAGKANEGLTGLFRDAFGGDHGELVARRRQFEPMLTVGPDGKPLGDVGGTKVEWWDPEREGGPGWSDLPSDDPTFTCRLLTDECGILFTGVEPPYWILDQGGAARLRITATIASDDRIRGLESRFAQSVNVDEHYHVLDVNRGFHARLLHSGSRYYSQVQNETLKAAQVDGREALVAFAQQAVVAWDQAHLAGTVRLESLENFGAYELGDLIEKLAGRNIEFTLNRATEEGKRFPQIIGMTHYVQAQKLVLAIAEFKQTDAYVASFTRKTRRLR
ncbi:MAG: hypothetical protein WD845_09060 [Pirellulales bacterium]